jgi:hypothetical protein
MQVYHETPFWICLVYYDSPREDCSGFYQDVYFYETKDECRKEYEELKKLNEGEPVGLSSSLDEE